MRSTVVFALPFNPCVFSFRLVICVVSQGLQAKAVEYFPKHPAIKSLPVLQNKHFVMWSLVAAATGMFMGAGMGGIRGNEDLRDIYDRRTGGGLTEQQVRSTFRWAS